MHPFREENGRALLEYIRHIGEKSGHRLTWDGVTSSEMIELPLRPMLATTGRLKPSCSAKL